MDTKSYRAYTMAEALAAVKHDLGEDALILQTRTFRRGGLLGLGRRTVVEVTATPLEDARPASSPASVDRSPLAALLAARAPLPPASRATDPPAEKEKPSPAPPDLVDSLRALIENGPEAEPEPEPAIEAAEPVDEAPPAGADLQEPEPEPVARRYILQPADDRRGGQAAGVGSRGYQAREPGRSTGPSGDGSPAPGWDEVMQQELSAIKQMVRQVLQRQPATPEPSTPELPGRLFEMYLTLIGQELSEELADRIVTHVREGLSADDLEDETTVREAALRHLCEYIPVAEEPTPSASPDGRPLIIALVGPTGVGKTTTLAKLAATFKLRHQRRVGLITADTYRIAAVDQLRTYADIIGVPLQVALSPADMRQSVQILSDCEVLLIDTAGRSHHDPDRIDELKRFIGAAEPHEVHLVLSSTAGERVLLQEAEAFGVVGIDRIVLTKLDEAVSFGVLVNVIRQMGKKLSFFTTGQEVPDHLECGRSERLADLVLGGELRS